jgi:predicted ester cyclase
VIAEGDKVVGRFTCSGTHTGPWQGHPPTNRRFTRIPEVYILTIRGNKITQAWGLEDTHRRMRQLGLR